MNKNISRMSSAAGCALLLMMVTANAQTSFRAKIPFDFTIGQKSYKAGEFSIGMLGHDAQSRVIIIRDSEGRNGYAISPSVGGSKPHNAILTFQRYGERYFLRAINTPLYAAVMPQSRSEAVIAKQIKGEQERLALQKK